MQLKCCIFCSRTMMFLQIHGPCLKLAALDISIRDSWSDEELVRFLAERKAEDPLPLDVIAGVDWYVLDPRCFTESLWHLQWLDDQEPYDSAENGIRKAKNGYWKPVGSSRIPTSTAIVGLKIIMEFYGGHAPCGKRTGWMMHEYQVEQNDEANLPQDYKSLWKLFLQSDKNAESRQSSLNANALNDSMESYLQYLAKIEERKHTVSANEKDTTSRTEQHEQKARSAEYCIDAHDVIAIENYIEMNDLVSTYNGPHEQKTEIDTDDIVVQDKIATDNYIELNDLLNSEASASTSENSSMRSMISEEYFDSDAFLKELYEDSNRPDGQHKNHKFSIATTSKLANVVISSTEQGFLRVYGDNATEAGPSQQKRVPGNDRDQHSSKEHQQYSSSISSCFPSSHVKRSHSDGSNGHNNMKSQGVRPTSKFGNVGMKYFCFGSF